MTSVLQSNEFRPAMIKESLDESAAIDATRLAVEPYRTRPWNTAQYLWEVISAANAVWVDDAASSQLRDDRDYLLTFDPNPQNTAARFGFSRLMHHDKMHFGYGCSSEDIRLLLAQPFAANADFYVLRPDGALLGFRTHEDPNSRDGLWTVARPA